MRNHSAIISDAGGPSAFKTKAALAVSIHNVRSWSARDSIPAEYWAGLANAGLATLEELATAAAIKASNDRLPSPSQEAAA